MKIYTNDFKCEKYDNLYFEYQGGDSFLYKFLIKFTNLMVNIIMN